MFSTSGETFKFTPVDVVIALIAVDTDASILFLLSMFDIVHEMEKPDTMHQFLLAMFGLVHERNNQKIPVKLAGNHNQEVQCRPSGVSFVE